MSESNYDQTAMNLAGEVADLPPAQRFDKLEELCGGNDDLRDRVLTLLSELSENGEGSPTQRLQNFTPSWFVEPKAEAALKRIGPYRLLARIGVGGMSEVFEAEQDRPRRRVALKLIHPLFMTPAAHRRFDFEVEILGRLDHPGIARVYDAGTAQTELGPQPYFAMELVRGRRLDRWLHMLKPDIGRRLRMLIDICEAVQHAHQHGVIHRDLKPANILITQDDKPKILDFGVATAVEGHSAAVAAETLHTRSGQIIGTLQYMSPEQAAGDQVHLDTRSDVYALGVIAYQLLCDRLPYDVSNKLLPDAVRIIREEEPTRLSTINRDLRGDLETIVLKALAKEREQRYGSSAELAADVKRFLDYEPITARPRSAWYQLSKFARRHKGLVAAACVVVLALVLGAGAATWGMLQARQQRAEALRQKGEAQRATADAGAVIDFFTNDVVGAANPAAMGKDVSVREALDAAARTVPQKFRQRPQVEAAVRNALAVTYASLGRVDLALPHARTSLELCRRELGDDHPNTLDAINNLADVLYSAGQLAAAEKLYREVLERSQRVLGPDHSDTFVSMSNLGSVLEAQGQLAAAEPLYRQALDGGRRALGEDHPSTLTFINNLANLLQAQDKLADAEPLFRESWDKGRRILGNDHPHTLVMINNMALLLKAQDKLVEAEPLFRESLDRRIQVFGEDHPDTLMGMSNMGFLLKAQGKLDEALPLYRDALERRRRVLGDDHPDTLISISNMGGLLQAQGKLDEAKAMYRDAVQRIRRTLGDDHPDTLRSIDSLAAVLALQGQFGEAEPLTRELYDRCPSSGMSGGDIAILMSPYGPCLAKLGRHREAEPPLLEAYSRLKAAGLDKHSRMRTVIAALAEGCEATGRPDESKRWRAEFAVLAPQPQTGGSAASTTAK